MCYFDYAEAVQAAEAFGYKSWDLREHTRQSDGARFWMIRA